MDDVARIDEFRAAIERQLVQFTDAHYEHLNQYYILQKPDPTRPIIDQKMGEVLDWLFDETQYPDGFTIDAVLARANANPPDSDTKSLRADTLFDKADTLFTAHLKAIMDPLWKATMLEGKRNRRKDGSLRDNISFTAVSHDFTIYADHFLEMMHEEARTIKREARQRAVLPMGVEALRDDCVNNAEAIVTVVIDGLEPFYEVTEQGRLSLRLVVERAVDEALANASTEEEGTQRRTLVTEVLDENFSRKMSEALTRQHVLLNPKRTGLSPKDLGAIVGLDHVQGDIRRNVARTVNRAFVQETQAKAVPETAVETASIEHGGIVDYRKVPFMHGNDMLSRYLLLRKQFEPLIVGDANMEPLKEQIFKAVQDARPPISGRTLKTAEKYFNWLEKDSTAVLGGKLAAIDGLGRAERELLLDVHQAAIPEMVKEAKLGADYLAGEMAKVGYVMP